MEEKDVFLCSAVYNEDDMKFRRNVRGGKVKHTYIYIYFLNTLTQGFDFSEKSQPFQLVVYFTGLNFRIS